MTTPLNILLIEDSKDDAFLLIEQLKRGGFAPDWKRVETEDEFSSSVGPHLDLIISDFTLPQFSVLRALELLRQHRLDLPFIVVSGTIGEERAVECLKAGATDYLLKDRLSRLAPMVSRALREAGERKDRQRAEQRNQLQANALEAAANGILITDRIGKILFANHAFCAMTGYPLEEVLGRNPRILKSDQHDPGFYRNLWQTILSGRVWRSEIINRRKDGTLYTEENTITPVRTSSGEITHFISVQEDITKRRNLEEQLRQAQKMESVGHLAGGVAHDFNNILTIIQGHASLLLSDPSIPDAVKESADQIAQAAERATGLIRQLLAFSRKQVMQSRTLDLNAVVSQMTKMLRRILGEDISLQVTFSIGQASIRADPGMMEQVLLNLAVNARDAMPRGGRLVITTTAETIDDACVQSNPRAVAGDYVCLTVRDDGCGIAPEILPRIFEPFFTTKDIGKGSGLGLATVYGIVQQHAGWITVQSEVGRGTAFQIFLPAIPVPITETAQVAETPARGGTETILLVEDEDFVRSLVCSTLERFGYTVVEASSGPGAWEAWRQRGGRFDLVITDIVMPGHMSGHELAGKLRAESPALPILYTSGYDPKTAGQDIELRDGVNFLQKPYSVHKLLQTIREAIDQRASVQLR